MPRGRRWGAAKIQAYLPFTHRERDFGCVPLIGQFQQTKIRANAPARPRGEASGRARRRGTVRVAPALPSPRGRAALTRRWSAAKSSIRYKKTKRPNNTNVSFLNDVSSPECPARRVFVFTEGYAIFIKASLRPKRAQKGGTQPRLARGRPRPPRPPLPPGGAPQGSPVAETRPPWARGTASIAARRRRREGRRGLGSYEYFPHGNTCAAVGQRQGGRPGEARRPAGGMARPGAKPLRVYDPSARRRGSGTVEGGVPRGRR